MMKPLKLLFAVAVAVLAAQLHVAGASAATLHTNTNAPPYTTVPTSSMPGYVYDGLSSCDTRVPLQSPAFAHWVSPSGQPATTTMSVNAGTKSVNLQYNFNGAYCTDSSKSRGTQDYITGVSAGVNGLNGAKTALQFPGPGKGRNGFYDSASKGFTYTPSGGFLPGTHSYTITVRYKSINNFNGLYLCVNRDGPGQDAHGGYNYQYCTEYPSNYVITVTAPNPTGDITCASNTTNISLNFNWDDINTGADITVVRNDGVNVYTKTSPPVSASSVSVGGGSVVQGKTYSYTLYNGDYLIKTVKNCKLKPTLSNSISCSVTSASTIHVAFSWNGITGGDAASVRIDTAAGPALKTEAKGVASGNDTADMTGLAPNTPHKFYLTNNGSTVLAGPTATCTTPCTTCGPAGPVSGNASVSLDSDEGPTSYTSSGSFNTSSSPAPTDFKCSITVTKNGGSPASSPPTACTSGSTVSGPGNPTTGQAGDQFCATITVVPGTWTVDGSGKVINESGSYTSVPSCATVKDRPLYKVFNSSISTGGDVGVCSTTTGALSGWYNNTTANEGSGAQLATYALAQIIGVGSNHTNNTRSAKGLSFANSVGVTPTDSLNPYLGGLLNGQNCLTALAKSPGGSDQQVIAPGNANIAFMTNPASVPAYTYGSNLQLTNEAGKPVDKPRALYVDGDIYIKNDIVYDGATTGWVLGSLPSFLVVATGNIYIAPGVTHLDGTYEAGGSIYTCGQNDFTPVPANELFNTCNNQLTVVGSFVAKKINFLRTFGTLHDDIIGGSCSHAGDASTSRATCAAEVFEFSPEQYLQKPAAALPGAGAIQYDAITSLPPVL